MTSSLTDPFGRTINYLRISVTDRCDMRCGYCLPQGFNDYTEPEDWLSFDEIERVAAVFARMGVHRVRLTGGEPLLRRNLPSLVSRLAALPGIEDLSLSSNGSQLSRWAEGLKHSGLHRLNLSLDTLDPEKFARITGRDVLPEVLKGLESAQAIGFPVRINMVVMPGVNEHEIPAMVVFCRTRGLTLRLIETMPMGETGRAIGTVDLQSIRQQLASQFGLIPVVLPGGGPARYLQSPDGHWRIGFITPLSQHFCDTCNRVRLSVDGALHLCLGQEDRVELRPLLRSGASEEALESAIRSAIDRKPYRHEFGEAPQKLVRFMAATGG